MRHISKRSQKSANKYPKIYVLRLMTLVIKSQSQNSPACQKLTFGAQSEFLRLCASNPKSNVPKPRANSVCEHPNLSKHRSAMLSMHTETYFWHVSFAPHIKAIAKISPQIPKNLHLSIDAPRHQNSKPTLTCVSKAYFCCSICISRALREQPKYKCT